MPPDPLELFHPELAAWFRESFPAPTAAQAAAWPVIASGAHALVTAPTGSGKTLTAFLWALNQFAAGAWETGGARVLYLSPLKALNQDIRRNLLQPLEALRDRAGIEIRAQVRSGDTTQHERRRMLRTPPEILITTPESLNILLASQGGRDLLSGLRTVILDEIHAVYGSKRGVHLITAVDRLTRLCGEFQRVALSATVRPLEAVADFVAGFAAPGRPRPIETVVAPATKRYDLRVRWLDQAEFVPEKDAAFAPLVDEIRATALRHRSTLVFVNTRRMAEKITWLVNKDAAEPLAFAHHGSLSREIRFDVEARLKAGALRAIVATNSLELGIDIGALDEVLMVQPPRSVASAIQRLGRAGHQVGAASHGRMFPLFPRELIEAKVLADLVPAGDLEPIRPVDLALDVLAQCLVSMCCVEARRAGELYEQIRLSHPYRELTREQFDRVLAMLTGRYEDSRVRELKPRLSHDPADDSVVATKGARLALFSSGGVIADRGYYQLRHADSNARIGELDEEFVWEARIGQILTFGTQAWKIQRITHHDVLVVPGAAAGVAPPFWRAEDGLRDRHFADRIAAFLAEAETHRKRDAFWADLEHLDDAARDALRDLLRRQRDDTGAALPHRHHLLVEQIHAGPGGGGTPGHQIILHTLWGGQVNQPLAFALEDAWHKRFGGELRTSASDYTVALVLPDPIDPAELIDLVCCLIDLESSLRRRLERSGFFGARFREAAGIALLLPGRGFDKRTPLWLTRLKAQKLFAAVQDREDFPVLLEAWRQCLRDEFDLPGLRAKLAELADGTIHWTAVHTNSPSPLAQGDAWRQVNEYMYLGDAPEAGAMPSNLSDELIREILADPGLRPLVPRDLVRDFEARRQRLHPGYAPEGPRELLDWLRERVLLPRDEFDALLATMENGPAAADAIADRLRRDSSNDTISLSHDFTDEALAEWISFHGPLTPAAIEAKIGSELAARVLQLDLVRGRLVEGAEEEQVCDPANYEALLRLRRHRAAPAPEPRPVTHLAWFLAAWQGLLDRDRHEGPEALRRALEPLLLHPGPAAAWERDWLPARVPGYRGAWLDGLLREDGLRWRGCGRERLCFHFDPDLDLLPPPAAARDDELLPDPAARYDFGALRSRRGGSAAELAGRLWSGVWDGWLTNDGFGALRTGLRHRFEIPEAAATGPRRRGFARWRSAVPLAGAWCTVPDPAESGDLVDEHERSRERARIVLERYGIVFRELLARELPGFRWADVFRALRLMELSGEIVSGWFFDGVPGPQFALPAALAVHRDLPADAVWWVNATDPASPCGLDLDALKGLHPKRLAGNHLVFRGPDLAMASERGGKSLVFHLPPDGGLLDVVHHTMTREFEPRRRITVEEIDGADPNKWEHLDRLRRHFDVAPDYRRIHLAPLR